MIASARFALPQGRISSWQLAPHHRRFASHCTSGMRVGSVVKKIDGYVIVIDPHQAGGGKFWPRYWIYDEDRLAAKPIASQEFPADCFDHLTAAALSEELARVKLADLKRRGGSGV
jgi:hypothetical protein